tara:strand:+ start:216 stop:395 length:180 start_codon:yes stop_codon:yes gene_type:complete
MPRLAYEILYNTGARVSDAHLLGKVNEKSNILTLKPFKGKDKYKNDEEEDEIANGEYGA